jgi:hypothetical protein
VLVCWNYQDPPSYSPGDCQQPTLDCTAERGEGGSGVYHRNSPPSHSPGVGRLERLTVGVLLLPGGL